METSETSTLPYTKRNLENLHWGAQKLCEDIKALHQKAFYQLESALESVAGDVAEIRFATHCTIHATIDGEPFPIECAGLRNEHGEWLAVADGLDDDNHISILGYSDFADCAWLLAAVWESLAAGRYTPIQP